MKWNLRQLVPPAYNAWLGEYLNSEARSKISQLQFLLKAGARICWWMNFPVDRPNQETRDMNAWRIAKSPFLLKRPRPKLQRVLCRDCRINEISRPSFTFNLTFSYSIKYFSLIFLLLPCFLSTLNTKIKKKAVKRNTKKIKQSV